MTYSRVVIRFFYIAQKLSQQRFVKWSLYALSSIDIQCLQERCLLVCGCRTVRPWLAATLRGISCASIPSQIDEDSYNVRSTSYASANGWILVMQVAFLCDLSLQVSALCKRKSLTRAMYCS